MSHLETLYPLLRQIAREYSGGDTHLQDDLLQEGAIKAWTMPEDKPREYVLAAARYAMKAPLRGRPPFGAEGRRGWQDAFDSAQPLIAEDGEDEVDPPDPKATEQAPMSAHRREIAEAVSSLPEERDAEIVFSRFWLDEGYDSMAQRMGVRNKQVLERRWASHIRPHLQEKLQHLRGA